ncbi:hypothetical protein [Nocardia farcinica]|uniref:Uncharacterized protein n=1 Tax=Nocardia farcinica (strain IFM 10152) TaxID=247156 RepID=Q5Z3T4_NOCFA|nr:hypothetical protein [Nocardia farcinica]BAD54907.1 hypothetical protein NFA_650 [Nocardia farcinica IFM 10152]
MSWIRDYCEQRSFILDEPHAAGLVKLHATCDPPCPRQRAAQAYLDEIRRREDDQRNRPTAIS